MHTFRQAVGGMLFVITGPSGSGKTTLAQALLKDRVLRRKVSRSVSFTTRPKRPNERQGKDYFFISEKEFARSRSAKKILEWTRYLGYYYGTEKSFVDAELEAGRSLLLCIDVKGARRIRSLYPDNSALIFVMPPSMKELERRIDTRCPGTCPKEIRRRLRRANAEIKEARWFDYRLVNKDFSRAVKKLKKIIASYEA
jgi:guanylate kinase